VAVFGLVITGVAAIVNVTGGFDVAPAQGFTTVTDAVPAVATLAAGTVAVSCVEETNVVLRSVPFQSTLETETKPVPVTVKVKPALPAAIQVGLIEAMVGFVPIVSTSVAVPVLQGVVPLVAPIVTLYGLPASVPVAGVPEITPVLVLILKPLGSPVAL
jgi:hypothetical protein